ncbi:MAG TPA: Fe-S cluster assembly protein SufD, partial [Nitrososphaerales archaeon]|nr:Fe-S cluster assembly protein SufD [Nitrososphaerales archaeon]
MSTTPALGSFDEAHVRSLSESMREPSWLTSFRLQSLADFASLPHEKNPLYTKYVRTFDFDLGEFDSKPAPEEVDFRGFFSGVLTGKERNIALQANGALVHSELDDDIGKLGVKLTSLGDAIVQDEGFVRKIFGQRQIKSGSDRMAAFVNAFFNCGTIVRIPRGVAVDRPLRRMLLLDAPKSGIVEQNFLVAEEASSVNFLEEFYSKGTQSSAALVASNTEIVAGASSHVDFSSVQLLDSMTTCVANRAIDSANDSHTTMSALCLGANVLRSRTNFYLNGRGSVAEGFEIFFTDGKQRYDFETNLVHNSPDSTGSTQARGVLKGESQSIFKGMIKIINSAKNSRSYLAHHAMLLERTAKSDAVPSLEIDNNEVRATHSASVAQIDDEQLFYLMARGLPPDEAKRMVVVGFFEPVLSRVPIEQTRDGARFMIEGKWQGEKRRLVDRESLLASTGEVTE